MVYTQGDVRRSGVEGVYRTAAPQQASSSVYKTTTPSQASSSGTGAVYSTAYPAAQSGDGSQSQQQVYDELSRSKHGYQVFGRTPHAPGTSAGDINNRSSSGYAMAYVTCIPERSSPDKLPLCAANPSLHSLLKRVCA